MRWITTPAFTLLPLLRYGIGALLLHPSTNGSTKENTAQGDNAGVKMNALLELIFVLFCFVLLG
jgi:hypothetical protein